MLNTIKTDRINPTGKALEVEDLKVMEMNNPIMKEFKQSDKRKKYYMTEVIDGSQVIFKGKVFDFTSDDEDETINTIDFEVLVNKSLGITVTKSVVIEEELAKRLYDRYKNNLNDFVGSKFKIEGQTVMCTYVDNSYWGQVYRLENDERTLVNRMVLLK